MSVVMSKYLVGFSSLIVLACICFAVARGTGNQVESIHGGMSRADVDTNRNEPVSIRTSREQESLKMKQAQVAALNRALLAMASQEKATDAETEDDADPKDSIAASEVLNHLDLLEDEFRKGTEDTAWGEEIEEYAERYLHDERIEGTSVSVVKCLTTMCELALEHDDKQAFERFMNQPKFSGPWDKGERFGTALMRNGKLVTRIFFSKEGEMLPTSEILVASPEEDS